MSSAHSGILYPIRSMETLINNAKIFDIKKAAVKSNDEKKNNSKYEKENAADEPPKNENFLRIPLKSPRNSAQQQQLRDQVINENRLVKKLKRNYENYSRMTLTLQFKR